MRVHCLGGGLVGSFVTRKLCEAGFEVHLFDIEPRETPATFHLGDAASADHSAADIIVNMVPGDIGHAVGPDVEVYSTREYHRFIITP